MIVQTKKHPETNEVIGYELIAENIDDNKVLGSIRNMHYWGFDDTKVVYAGIELEPELVEGKEAVKQMHFIQKKHKKD